MKRHYFGLTLVFLVFGLLFTACSNVDSTTNPPTLPSVQETYVIPTDEPTEVPTATPTSEPTATPLPTATPTLEPTPTAIPTEIPMYIGLPADEVEALRERCLEQNSDLLCLPLPFDPSGVTLQWETESWSSEQFIYVGSAEKGNSLVMDSATGKRLEPGDVMGGSIDWLFEGGTFNPEDFESLGGVSAVSSYLRVAVGESGITIVAPLTDFVFYDLDADPSAQFYGTEFEWERSGVNIHIFRPDPNGTKPWHVLPFGDGEVSLFEAAHLSRWAEGVKFFGRSLFAGEVVSEIEGLAEINVFFNNVRTPSVICSDCGPSRPPRAGEQTWRDGLFEDDLLRNDAGSIVYVLPNP